jgi:hypothetical protein
VLLFPLGYAYLFLEETNVLAYCIRREIFLTLIPESLSSPKKEGECLVCVWTGVWLQASSETELDSMIFFLSFIDTKLSKIWNRSIVWVNVLGFRIDLQYILIQYDIINDADNMASLTTISKFTLSITIKMQHPAYNYAECPI